MTTKPIPSSRLFAVLAACAIALNACTVVSHGSVTNVNLRQRRVPTPFPDDDTREWVVTDSAGRQHTIRLIQQATATDARTLTVQDSGRTLFTMSERWVRGKLLDWFLDTRDVLTLSPEGNLLRWPVTPGSALTKAVASRPDSTRAAGFLLSHSPALERGMGCAPYTIQFLAASLRLDAALIEQASPPAATSVQRATLQASLVGAGYDKYSTCIANSKGVPKH